MFSVIASAKRTHYYKDFYDSLAGQTETISFEVIFVGPNPPTQKMPDNFRYITTNVKPTQCLEIAAREATGEYLIVGGDDVRFSEGFLDKLHGYTLRLDMQKTLISFRYTLNSAIRDFQLVLDLQDVTAPICGQSPLFSRQVWHDLGGLDQTFAACMSDIDMQMRFYERGYQPFITPDCIMNEIVTEEECKRGTVYRKAGRSDTFRLMQLWGRQQKRMARAYPVTPFDNKDILDISQGELKSTGKRGGFVWN